LSRFTLQWKIKSADEGKLIKDFLKDEEISKASLTDIKFSGGRISLNNEEVTVRKSLKTGDVLLVEFPNELRSNSMKGEVIPLNILYEDPYLLIVNKPAGMNTIPSKEHPSGSLANGIIGYYEQISFSSTVHIVTRLDRDTSGLVLVAKHRHIHHLLSKQQKEGSVKRGYIAFAEGVFAEKKGTIEKPIGRKATSIIEREVQEEGQYACTHYEVLKQFPSFAQVKLNLETGRTHQIRVHLVSMGHPLLGDDLYGGEVSLINRQALHCYSLSFFHPIQKETLNFEIPLPSDMEFLTSISRGS
jgi:23S rRNA pseudouridine1911/1915/1917 synthase